MVAVIGTSWPVFLGVTIGIMGFAAYMTGQALANGWRPMWQVIAYAFPLGFADRFLVFALFDGELLLLSGYLVDTAILAAIGLISYRLAQVRRMVTQYPWLYERTGPFSWREKEEAKLLE